MKQFYKQLLSTILAASCPVLTHSAAAADTLASAQATLTMLIQAPGGNALRLSYVQYEGWKLVGRTEKAKVAAAALTVSDEQTPETAEEPQTVFIDGPTGYVFTWMRDTGWQFVGHVAERQR